MNILLVNKFYHAAGGDCIHVAEIARLLSREGHNVALLTMSHDKNSDLPQVTFIAPEVRFNGKFADKLRAAARALTGQGAIATFKHAMRSFAPDIVHLHNIHSYLSPKIAEIAKEHGATVLWTLHDYKLVCGAYTLLRNDKPCNECFTNHSAIIHHRCMKESLSASLLAWAEKKVWNVKRLQSLVDAFVCPSEFMRQQMIAGGYDPHKLVTIYNFVPQTDIRNSSRNGVCYIGRLSPEKGVKHLLEAAAKNLFKLTIAGTGPLEMALRQHYTSYKNITFTGLLPKDAVQALVCSSKLSVLPSIWHENCPLSVIESLCAGTPVVASKVGGIPELVDDNCGILVPPGNTQALATAITQALTRDFDYEAIARSAQSRFCHYTDYLDLLRQYFERHSVMATALTSIQSITSELK